MRLLHTETFTLRQFPHPPKAYAILSHVWYYDDESIQAIQSESGGKERLACRYAANDGFTWLWIDSRCIDTANSTELSEAINSMYQWYAGATVCYAYLADVPGTATPDELCASFRKSKWHTRGWTLQELIAPHEVMFISSDWTPIGNKAFLAPLIQEVTGIDTAVLTHQTPLSSVSVARRMAWASSRTTTRLEDEAYCLMGIFDVNIPVIYGEGRRAFRRLQEEILRTSPDHSLLVWGHPLIFSTNPASNVGSSVTPLPHHQKRSYPAGDLFAATPSCFAVFRNKPGISSCNRPAPTLEHMSYTEYLNKLVQLTGDCPDVDDLTDHTTLAETPPIPEFTVTSYGVRAYLPIIVVPRTHLYFDWELPQDDFCIALLACRRNTSKSCLLTGLVLRRPSRSHAFEVGGVPFPGPHWPRGRAGGRPFCPDVSMMARFLDITSGFIRTLFKDRPEFQDQVVWKWMTLHISQQHCSAVSIGPSSTKEAHRRLSILPDDGAYVLIPASIIARLAKQGFKTLDYTLPPEQYWDMRQLRRGRSTKFTFHYCRSDPKSVSVEEGFRIHIGMCHQLWITVEDMGQMGPSIFAEPLHPNPPSFDRDFPCLYTHLDAWQDSSVADLGDPTTSADKEFYSLGGFVRRRIFVVDGKTFRISLAEYGRQGGVPLWAITVEVSSSEWSAAHRLTTLVLDNHPTEGSSWAEHSQNLPI